MDGPGRAEAMVSVNGFVFVCVDRPVVWCRLVGWKQDGGSCFLYFQGTRVHLMISGTLE